ncbi:ABC transporter substrate-binding protein [Micromonospora echinofusca]|uniref:Extracellular solute-binding protein n=1 Tax=Micromonospora echinofusca TaxID=47858 RepID=A0ABS3VLK6_MICEH|nr:ABC transporter substrate-binding protein [Micromonospora echinofusca]MBO4205264.1 extracellular solute-binding protein [Micromonospora echinofusca]
MDQQNPRPGVGLTGASLSRRGMLRGALAAGLAVPSVPLLAACGGSSQPKTNDTPGTLSMTAWEAYPEQIRALLAKFKDQSAVPVDLSLIPNVGYGPALQTRLQGGQAIDVFYNFAYASTKYVDAGWAATLNKLPGVEELIDDMFPASAARHRLADGRIISVPYFSAVHSLMYNENQLRKNGIAAPPATKEEVYAQSKKLKAAGVPSPYAAYWTKQFLEEYFLVYLLADGITPFDGKGAPAFADDPRTLEVMEWWKSMYQEGLTSKEVLTADPGAHVTAMAQGNSSFFELHHYFLQIVRTTDGPESKNVTMLYRSPGTSGKTLQIGEVIQLGAKAGGQRAQDAWKLLKFYGWKDDSGAYSTFSSWAKAAALLGPYPGLFKDKDFLAAFPSYFDMAKLEDAFANQSDVVPARVTPWYASFQVKVGDRIQAMLLGQAGVKETVDSLASDAKNLAAAGQ